MKKNVSKKCSNNHEFYIVRSWYEREDYDDYSSTSHIQKRPKIWKILVFCKKCGETRILKIRDED